MLVKKEINSSLLYKLSYKKSISLGGKNYSLKGPSDKNLQRINRNAPQIKTKLDNFQDQRAAYCPKKVSV